MSFVPIEGSQLTINLPGELLRADVRKVVTPDAVIVEIATEPLARLQHNYKQGDVVACRRIKTMFGEDWKVVEKRTNNVEDLIRQEIEAAPKPIIRKKKAKVIKVAIKKPKKKPNKAKGKKNASH